MMAGDQGRRNSLTTGCTVWLTGLSKAGKSTIAGLVEDELRSREVKVDLVDEERSDGIAETCRELAQNGVIAINPAGSPNRAAREQAREVIGAFIEVFVDCPPGIRLERGAKDDPNGLYEKPVSPELSINTDQEPAVDSAARVIRRLEELAYINPHQDDDVYSEEEKAELAKRLADLGYM